MSLTQISGNNYRVTTTWNPLAGATSYTASIASNNVTLTTVSITQTTWTIDAQLTPTKYVSVTVTPKAAKAKSQPATVSKLVPDVSAPTGTFDVTWDHGTGETTVNQSALSDDVTPAASITREINWDRDNPSWQSWASGTSTTHQYAGQGRWVPQVRLTDGAGNARVLDLHAVVVGDNAAPTATLTSGPLTGWATVARVTLTQTGLHDNYTPVNLIARTVVWGDGTVTQWAGVATVLAHTYMVAGTFTPKMIVADEAGNTATINSTKVAIRKDTYAPKVALKVPAKPKRIKSWKSVKGTITDVGLGAKRVTVSAIEKRGTVWYAYRGTKTWVKAGTMAAAWGKARAVSATPVRGAWATPLRGLAKGKLKLRVVGWDKAGNKSPMLAHKARVH